MKKAYSYIRFSTPEQKKGNSFKRQTELAAEWALKNGYELVNSIGGITLLDDGITSFNGENIKTGALGVFCNLVRNGKIEPGSALVVESLDRLSREGPVAFLPLFLEVINCGIVLITLIDGERRYEKTKINEMDLMVTIIQLSSAHEESAKKSYRAWMNHNIKRAEAREKGLVGDGMVPAWIKRDKITKKVELIKERAVLINRIVERYISGQGESLVAKWLNSSEIPAWGTTREHKATKERKPTVWTKEYLWRLLRNRQLIGEHQLYYFPHADVAGEKKHRKTSEKIKDRKPDGSPLKNYFPAVLSEETFAVLQREVKKRSGRTGRKGNIESLFPFIAKCGYCGASMSYKNSGRTKLKNGEFRESPKYLICSSHKNGVMPSCVRNHVSYKPIEVSFLKWCREVNIKSLIGRVDCRERLDKLEKDHAEAIDAIEKINEEIKNLELLVKELHSLEAIKKIAQNIDSAYAAHEDFSNRRERIEKEIVDLESSDGNVKDHLEALDVLYEKLHKSNSQDEKNIIRLQLRHAIASAVHEVEIFHDGLHNQSVDWTTSGVELVEYVPERENGDLYIATKKGDEKAIKIAQFDYDCAVSNYIRLNTGKENAAFLVVLKNGSKRLFHWNVMKKEYDERLAFEKDAERIILDGSIVELNYSNLSEADLKKEIEWIKNN